QASTEIGLLRARNTRRKAGRTATCNSKRFGRRKSTSDGTISSRSRGSGRRPPKARANSSPCREATIFRTNRSASSVPSRSPTIRKSAPSSRTRSDRCSPNRAGRRFREIRPRPLRQIGPIRVSPSARALGGSVIGLSLKRGLGYLAKDPEDTAVSFVRVLAEAHTPFLWITSRAVSAPPDGGDLIRVTTIAGGLGTEDHRRLKGIRTAATTFFDERGPGALVVDCLDPLVVHSGVERVLRFVDDLHEETATRNAWFVVFADPRTMNPRMIAWLERELDPFPSTAANPSVEDHLIA